MFRILLPVDLSESTTNACQYALSLAAAVPDAHILLMHCFQDYLADADPDTPSTAGLSPSDVVTERVLHRNEAEAQQQFDALYESLLSRTRSTAGHVHLDRTFIHGLPEDRIPEQIERFHPNLVIMGTKGESNLARSFFGTVTTKLVQDIRVPVLTVPQHVEAHRISRVLYATDFDATDTQTIADLLQLLEPLQPVTYCVHVSEHSDKKDREKLAALQQELQSSTGGNVHFMLLEGDNVADTLQDFAKKESIDVLALTTRERDILASIFSPSLAKKLVLHAELPLLVFHSEA
ncbi:universal stress protein [Pontibacter ruber]|uniref:Universal stress protein n=1 Tax=Pontibacter ruber TaxID=1343895 RepID=A0ABW5D2C2_9BACT|nr:universal stress protein [Pontibacter ruber]